jgi:hypothetical protein
VVFWPYPGENQAVKKRTSQAAPAPGAPEIIRVNSFCVLRKAGDHHIAVVHGLPMAKFALGERFGEALTLVNLVFLGHVTQAEAAKAFGWSVQDVDRVVRANAEGGGAAVRDLVGTFLTS